MASHRKVMECLGLDIDGSKLPPFELHAGEALCLHIEHSTIPWYEGILKLLRGDISHPCLSIDGRVRYLERPMPRRGWFGRRKDILPRNWLVKEGELSAAEADQVLSQLTAKPDFRIGWMGWNERTLLALEAYLVHAPDILVFDTAGQDPQGICAVFARLASRPPMTAIIYLKTVPEAISECFPGAMCLEVTTRSPEVVSAE